MQLFEIYANGFKVLDRQHVNHFRFRMVTEVPRSCRCCVELFLEVASSEVS
jgi:hypothetical protein